MFGHLFYAHFPDIDVLGLGDRLTKAFTQYYLILNKFGLISSQELEPIQYLVERVNQVKESIQIENSYLAFYTIVNQLTDEAPYPRKTKMIQRK
jgi:hypothetical protein